LHEGTCRRPPGETLARPPPTPPPALRARSEEEQPGAARTAGRDLAGCGSSPNLRPAHLVAVRVRPVLAKAGLKHWSFCERTSDLRSMQCPQAAADKSAFYVVLAPSKANFWLDLAAQLLIRADVIRQTGFGVTVLGGVHGPRRPGRRVRPRVALCS
jgi:hypothetical protein